MFRSKKTQKKPEARKLIHIDCGSQMNFRWYNKKDSANISNELKMALKEGIRENECKIQSNEIDFELELEADVLEKIEIDEQEISISSEEDRELQRLFMEYEKVCTTNPQGVEFNDYFSFLIEMEAPVIDMAFNKYLFSYTGNNQDIKEDFISNCNILMAEVILNRTFNPFNAQNDHARTQYFMKAFRKAAYGLTNTIDEKLDAVAKVKYSAKKNGVYLKNSEIEKIYSEKSVAYIAELTGIPLTSVYTQKKKILTGSYELILGDYMQESVDENNYDEGYNLLNEIEEIRIGAIPERQILKNEITELLSEAIGSLNPFENYLVSYKIKNPEARLTELASYVKKRFDTDKEFSYKYELFCANKSRIQDAYVCAINKISRDARIYTLFRKEKRMIIEEDRPTVEDFINEFNNMEILWEE